MYQVGRFPSIAPLELELCWQAGAGWRGNTARDSAWGPFIGDESGICPDSGKRGRTDPLPKIWFDKGLGAIVKMIGDRVCRQCL